MNFRKNNSLKNLKAESLKTQELSTFKGGNYTSLLDGDGTSKPKRPTNTSYSMYVGMSFGD